VLKNLLAATLLLSSALGSASPDVFAIGKTKISIVIPDGYCALSFSQPDDNRVLSTFDRQAKGKHRRLAFMVNCEQLNEWRYGVAC
jgi:hypothetical protein